MNQILRITSGFLLLLFFLSGCKNKEFVDFYKRPDNLPPCIYQQLQAKGNFKSLLALVDKAGYKETLSQAGYWTFFAPNDSAFIKYLAENSITGGIASIDSATARKIVTFSLVYNSYRQDQLTNYQSSIGVIPNLAFKKKTVYYDFVQTESGSPRKVIANNSNNGVYVVGDNSNKNISFFTDAFINAVGLSATDYNFFYPNTKYTGFNVMDASVIESQKNIVAENGMIHVLNRVILPALSIDQYLASNPNYSEFKKLLDMKVNYQANADLTHRYNVLTGKPDSVFIKIYNSALGFSPNNENYLTKGTSSQTNGYTFMVPTNDVLLAYTKKLLTYFGSFNSAPPEVLNDFISSLMFGNNIWPSRIQSSTNVQGESPTFAKSNVIDQKLLSNGIFYGTNKVQDANVFRTLYSKPYLNPNYTLMLRGLNAEVKYSIVIPSINYIMFMMPDVQVRAGGFEYDATREASNNTPWGYKAPLMPVGTFGSMGWGGSQRDQFYRVLKTSVSAPNMVLPDLSGDGIIEMYNGEYIRYKNNTIWAAGNMDAGSYIVKDSSQTVVNGTVYYTHEVIPTGKSTTGGLLYYTTKTIGYHLQALSVSDPTNYGSFYKLLAATLLDANLAILGTSNGTFYTVFVPTNAAIVNAVKQGILPAVGAASLGVPNFAPAAGTPEADLVIKFIQYHILNKNTVVPDGRKDGAFATLLVNAAGDPTYITVSNQLNNMKLIDMFNNTSNVVVAKSNNLSNFTVIHSIDNFLKYKY